MRFFRRRPRQVAPLLHGGASCADADQEITWLRGENKQLRDERGELVGFVMELQDELDAYRATKTGGGPPPAPVRPGTWRSGPSTRPATAPEEET